MITLAQIVHWLAALLLVTMAVFALIEAKSSSLIPRSLFLWPLAGLVLGTLILLSLAVSETHRAQAAILTTGFVMILCSLQALAVNVRRIPRWPSGLIWLGWIVVCLLYQPAQPGAGETLFLTFYRRLAGLIWAAVGITKVISERSAAQEGGIPAWIQLLFVQAALMASAPF
jgi:hypothetical protein